MVLGISLLRIQESGTLVCRMARLVGAGFVLLQITAVFYVANAQQPLPGRSLARSYFAAAQKALATGNSAAALEKLNQAVKADSTYADAYLLLGLTEFQHGDTARAIEHYKRALELQPRTYSGHYNLALAYLRERRLQDGRAQLEQAVNLDPKQADAAYDLGLVLLELGQPAAALPHLVRARRLNPRRPDVAFNIVRAELEAGRVAEARSEAQASATQLGPDFQWNAAIGQLFLKNAQPGDASAYLHKAHLLRPDNDEVRHHLAVAYLESRQPARVLETIGEPKTGDDHYLRGSAYYLDHRFLEAEQESELALVKAPENPQILVLRVRVLQRAGQQHEALKLARKAIGVAPNWDEPYYLAGVSLYFIRLYGEAGQSLAKAAELNPNSARALFMEAVALSNQGKQAEAQKCLRRSIALQPDNGRLHCHLGILLARENEYAEAEASLRRAIQLKPGYALPHYELAKLLVHSMQWKTAAQELEQAITQDPNLSAAYYQLARVYAKLGETGKSERMLAEFRKIHQQENDTQAADQAVDEDTRKETEF